MGLTPTLRATRVAMRRTWARVQVVWGGAIEQHGRICERTCAVGKLSRTWTSGFASLLVGGHRSSLFFFQRGHFPSRTPSCALLSAYRALLPPHRDLRGTAIPLLGSIAEAFLAKTAIISTTRIASNRGF